jgi:3-isopropylmalate/(R)-2-methylmalate dehydratase large subunit
LPSTAKDLTLGIVKHFGSNGALGKVVELYGDITGSLNLSDRITISSMGTEIGAIAIMIPPNNEIISFCKSRSNDKIEPIYADSDAVYCDEINLEMGEIEPQISLPGNPENVKTVKEVEGKKIDSVFIGSCTNGRADDINLAMDIIKDYKVAPGVMAKIVPATKEVFGELLSKGIIAKLFHAGFIISNQGCGGCASGQIGITGQKEVQLSTSNRNFPGKQGTGETYLCSPATAAISAVNGKITVPGA